MKAKIKTIVLTALSVAIGVSAQAASVQLVPTSNTVGLQAGDTVSFDIVADFSTNDSGLGSDITLGGGFDVVYDPDAFALVSVQSTGIGDPCIDCNDPDLAPGLLLGWWFSNFNGLTGGLIGHLEFEVLPTAPASTFLMTRQDPDNLFVSTIDFVTVLDVEFGAVEVTTVPVPAAVWLLFSAVGVLSGFARRRAH